MRKKTEISGIKVEANARNLALIRKFIDTGMKAQGFSRDKISAMKVSLTEHCENLIRHAYAGTTGNVELIMELAYPAAKIRALDEGPEFDMKAHGIPDITHRLKKGIGGKMGLKTILALCDKVEYKRKNPYNENVFIIGSDKKRKVK